MEGYDVVTIEDEKVGKVVGTHGDHLIVEQGMLRKSKHALPQQFADVDESEQLVRMTVSKDVFCDSPVIEDGDVDEQAIAEHYGLVFETAVDPPGHAEQDATRADVPSATEERLHAREGETRGEAGLPAESPALLGDRVSDVDERQQQRRD
jgi:hypothetical protein